jgi:hypothetical protein
MCSAAVETITLEAGRITDAVNALLRASCHDGSASCCRYFPSFCSFNFSRLLKNCVSEASAFICGKLLQPGKHNTRLQAAFNALKQECCSLDQCWQSMPY